MRVRVRVCVCVCVCFVGLPKGTYVFFFPSRCEVDDLVELPHSQQKCVSIPLDEDGEDYDTCEYYVQNYSMYNNMELMQRNCTHYADEGLYREECTSWVYDQSQYLTTITSEVSCTENRPNVHS